MLCHFLLNLADRAECQPSLPHSGQCDTRENRWNLPGTARSLSVHTQTLPVCKGRSVRERDSETDGTDGQTVRQLATCTYPARYCFRALLLVFVSSLSNTDFLPPFPAFWLAAAHRGLVRARTLSGLVCLLACLQHHTFSWRFILWHRPRPLWSTLSFGCSLSKHLGLQNLELSTLLRLTDR